MFRIVCTTGYGPDKKQQQRVSFGKRTVYSSANMEKRKTQEEKQDKNIAETGIIYHLSFRAFG